MFRRGVRPPVTERLRGWLWPRKGWRRGFEYLGHRVKRIADTPHRIAVGVAAGAFVSFSPFFGFHFVYAALVAWIFRGNIVAGLIGTALGNPLTFPAIAASALGLGRWILGAPGGAVDFGAVSSAFGEALGGLWQGLKSLLGAPPPDWTALGTFLHEVYLPYIVGGTISGGLCAAPTYWLSRGLVAAYQARRRSRLMARARDRVAAGLHRTAGRERPVAAPVPEAGQGSGP